MAENYIRYAKAYNIDQDRAVLKRKIGRIFRLSIRAENNLLGSGHCVQKHTKS